MDRETLIIKHAHLVKILAFRLAVRLPPHIEIDDLISVGITGLIEAIDRFDPARGVKLETYLSFRIKGMMLDELRRMDWIPRSIREKVKQLEKEYRKIETQLGRTPTEEELAESLGMEDQEFHRFLHGASGMAILSLEDMGLNGGSGYKKSIMECMADPNGEDPVTCLNLKETKEFLGRAIDELPEKERFVLSLYYYEDLNQKEIGKVLGVTESRICQIHSQAVFKLKGRLRRLRGFSM